MWSASITTRISRGRSDSAAEVIVAAVRWYLRFNLSCRDVEELLVDRGVEVSPVPLALPITKGLEQVAHY